MTIIFPLNNKIGIQSRVIWLTDLCVKSTFWFQLQSDLIEGFGNWNNVAYVSKSNWTFNDRGIQRK